MDQTRIVPALGVTQAPLETVQVLELEANGEASGDWITRLLSSGLFRHLTPEHSHRFFAELEPVSVRAGQVVVEQGQQGDHFYVVTQGRCAVTRQVPGSNRELQLNVLRDGDTFGESPLISGTPRTTTVRMLSDGTLMRLDRRRFEQLVADPMLSTVSYDEARRLVDEGAVWLDVRQHDPRRDHIFDGSLSVPAHVFSIEAPRLDSTKTYVVYCEGGTYSSTGAFLLTRLGFEAHVLDGGLARMRTDARVAVEQAARTSASGPEPLDGASAAGHGTTTHEVPSGDDAVAQPSAPLGSLEAETGGAIAAADQAEERTRVLSQQNSVLKRLMEVQRDKHRAVERQFEHLRGELERRIEIERESFLRKLKSVRRKLRNVRRDGAQAVSELEDECGAKASALRNAGVRVNCVVETARSIESERSRLEQLLKEADTRLMDTGSRLSETTAKLLASDAKLSKTMAMLADANKRLTAMTVQRVETNQKLSSTQAQLEQAGYQHSRNATQHPGVDEKPSGADSRFQRGDGELAEMRVKLDQALAEKVEEKVARQRAESALEIALAELQSHVEGLATLRCALTGEVVED